MDKRHSQITNTLHAKDEREAIEFRSDIINLGICAIYTSYMLQGVPKKMVIRKSFEFLTLGGVFLGVKNNSKNFGNKKMLGCLATF